MLGALARNWWLFAIRGIAAIVFGVLAFAWPNSTLTVLVYLFGAYVLIDGASFIAAVLMGDPLAQLHKWAIIGIGLIGIVAGIVTFLYPGLTAMTLLYIVAFWAIGTGILQLASAITLRDQMVGAIWMGVGGLLSVVFGILLIAFPGDGLVSLVWLVGLWAVVFGISSLGLAYDLRQINKAVKHGLA
jgi:uncharacterized membrane protein HdeD (DUF308 family)